MGTRELIKIQVVLNCLDSYYSYGIDSYGIINPRRNYQASKPYWT